jgi:adenylylsulfate kinase
LVAELKSQLAGRGVDAAVLESDALRRVLTPHPRYDDEERAIFYQQMVYIGSLLAQHGVPVIFDATANRRRFRDQARQQIPRYVEVYVDCPLQTCMARDPKGIYRTAGARAENVVPGLQATYEAPENPDIVVRGEEEVSASAAVRVIAKLVEKGYLSSQ